MLYSLRSIILNMIVIPIYTNSNNNPVKNYGTEGIPASYYDLVNMNFPRYAYKLNVVLRCQAKTQGNSQVILYMRCMTAMILSC
jgi:hypothetical protein